MPSKRAIQEWAKSRQDIVRLIEVEGFSQAEVARIKGVSRERICQIYRKERERRKENDNGNR